jgi:hypothetical protein
MKGSLACAGAGREPRDLEPGGAESGVFEDRLVHNALRTKWLPRRLRGRNLAED